MCQMQQSWSVQSEDEGDLYRRRELCICDNTIFIGRNLDIVETYQSLKLKSDQNTFAWRAREINFNQQLENKENEVIVLKIDHEDG